MSDHTSVHDVDALLRKTSIRGHNAKQQKRFFLLLGVTGSGKSTVGCTLCKRTAFKTSCAADSCTPECSSATFEEDGIEYHIIDTVGMMDTKLTPREVLQKIVHAIALTENNGVNQFVWVVKDRFTKKEVQAYNILNKTIFGGKMGEHLTIVRTNFQKFEDEEQCREDIRALREMPDVAAILKHVDDANIVHVDNDWTEYQKETKRAMKEEDNETSRAKMMRVLSLCESSVMTPTMVQASQAAEEFRTQTENLKKANEQQANLLEEARLKAAQTEEEKQRLKKKLEDAEEETKQKEQEFKEAIRKATEEGSGFWGFLVMNLIPILFAIFGNKEG